MTAAPPTANMRFERVTLYVDLESEELLLPTITECVANLTSVYSLFTRKNMEMHEPSPLPSSVSSSATTLALLRRWQEEEADVYTYSVNNDISFMNTAELLITDKNTTDGAVTYAIYRRQMPVLSLAPTHLPARTSLQQLLYTGAAVTTVAERKEAVQRFLTFPAACGLYTVASTTAAGDAAAAVVVVNADGYPVQLPQCSPDSTRSTSLLPPPPTLFATVMAELRDSDDTYLDVLRHRNPTLPGVLAALHRYQNRGVLRAMLHRGYRIEVAAEAAAAGVAWVHQFATLTSKSGEEAAERVEKATATLAKFESHWLELPVAERETHAE